MNQRLISEIGKSQRLQILNRLKRTQGLPVAELAEKLGMSYMGVKQHCIELAREGYLDTWRKPKAIGRPEMLYRLTAKANGLFPATSNELTLDLLEAAQRLFGPAAAEKLLFTVFHTKADGYLARIKGKTPAERAKAFARLRDTEGYMSDVEAEPELRIVEHHSPILDLLRAFPITARLENEMFQRVLGAAVTREETTASGQYQCAFKIDARD